MRQSSRSRMAATALAAFAVAVLVGACSGADPAQPGDPSETAPGSSIPGSTVPGTALAGTTSTGPRSGTVQTTLPRPTTTTTAVDRSPAPTSAPTTFTPPPTAPAPDETVPGEVEDPAPTIVDDGTTTTTAVEPEELPHDFDLPGPDPSTSVP